MKNKLNQNGFTLVELLATMAILSALMIIAIPNVIGIVQKNKNKTYIEDAKKLETLATYKVRSNPTELKPSKGQSYCFLLPFLDKSNELSEPPNGGVYDKSTSYVIVTNDNGTLKYYVQLIENKGSLKIGIKEVESTELYKDNATTNVKSTSFEPKKPTNASKYFYKNNSYAESYEDALKKLGNNGQPLY